MRILVLSDSHTGVDTMDLVFSRVHPDMIIHRGDSVIDAVLLHSRYPDVLFEMVESNTEKNSDRIEQNIIHIGPISVLLTHGAIETSETDFSCSKFFVDAFGKSAYIDSRFESGYTLNL